MFSWRRGVDALFNQDEFFFWRLKDFGYNDPSLPPETLALQIVFEQFSFPDQSVNRSKYSRPTDVLFPRWTTWGVLEFPFRVAAQAFVFPTNSRKGNPSVNYRFQPTHAPEAGNYAHTEIWVFKDGVRVPRREKSKIVPQARRKYREALVSEAVVVRNPTPSERFSWFKRRLGR
jgi:hypothetical protein